MKFTVGSLFLVASATSGLNSVRKLEEGCVNHELAMLADEFPGDISVFLECDGSKVWDFEAGDFTVPFELIELSTCQPEGATCDLTVGDNERYADGLTSPMIGGEPGFIAYSVDGEMVGFYAADGPETDYSALQFCSGPLCAAGRNVGVGGVQDCDQFITMSVTFDDFPSENSWTLTCDSQVVWNEDGFLPNQQFETVHDFACVAATACCDLEVRDSSTFGDGLTSPQSGTPGGFKVKVNSNTVAEYDGSAPNANFELLMYKFGAGCAGAV